MSKIFFTSDIHAYHDNILNLNPSTRGIFRDMNEMISYVVQEWNSVVDDNDTVYILGDLAFKNVNTFLRMVKGKKFLVLGNHDNVSHIDRGLLVNRHIPTIHDIKMYGRTYVLSHYPMRVWNKAHYCSAHLFGHVHGMMETHNMSMDVGMDTNNLKLYSDEYIEEFMRKRYDDMVLAGRWDGKIMHQDDVKFFTSKKLFENRY